MLIALSGGGDSVGLLTALGRIRARLPGAGFDLLAATVDHGLRPGSREEAVAAGHLSESFGVPHVILDWTGEKPSTGLQAAAREARYGLLARHALDKRADLILTGHNLDDNIETYRMRMARNADPDTHGMAEAVLLQGKIWAVRPLLGLRREAIRAYLRSQGVGWVEDPSNVNTAFERVRLRSQIDETATPDFAALMQKRRARMRTAAAFLGARAEVIGLKVGVVDLRGLDAAEPGLLDGLAALAALLGGREHLFGLEAREALARFLVAGRGQMTTGRTVFDRRGDRLYVQRENRGLPATMAAPGQTVIWDNRFRIANPTEGEVSVGGPGVGGEQLIDAALFDRLPGRVRQLALRTGPFIAPGGANRHEITAFLPGCDKFLPLDRLELGNFLAKLMGLPHFPSPVFRQQV
ncbi:tRNA lysidine(34) synthetase TilS [Rhizobium sp. FKL33]|uniref:tRNA lysidine(34) synthetase TilS n=1 Tax=Rhizobium sp. FKL33 TaxID=2562307 RepID=UPI00148545CB|nr:tRNA lysidine(34) synthetase TilS [Rhizobium sp. FKL33]